MQEVKDWVGWLDFSWFFIKWVRRLDLINLRRASQLTAPFLISITNTFLSQWVLVGLDRLLDLWYQYNGLGRFFCGRMGWAACFLVQWVGQLDWRVTTSDEQWGHVVTSEPTRFLAFNFLKGHQKASAVKESLCTVSLINKKWQSRLRTKKNTVYLSPFGIPLSNIETQRKRYTALRKLHCASRHPPLQYINAKKTVHCVT